MAIDYIVNKPCEPKLHFGDGDAFEGTVRILDMLKARNRAAAAREVERVEGHGTERIVVNTIGPDGLVTTEVSVADLEQESAPLDSMARHCEGCSANLQQIRYGCFGAVNYPIRFEAEKWLMNLVQTSGTLGGAWLWMALEDFQYAGAPIAEMRAQGFFESRIPVKKVFEKKLFRSKAVTSDQIFEAILAVGDALQPHHSMLLLLWFGAIALDGRPLIDPDEAPRVGVLSRMPQDQRSRRTKLIIRRDPEREEMTNLIDALYRSWTHDVELIVSA